MNYLFAIFDPINVNNIAISRLSPQAKNAWKWLNFSIAEIINAVNQLAIQKTQLFDWIIRDLSFSPLSKNFSSVVPISSNFNLLIL